MANDFTVREVVILLGGPVATARKLGVVKSAVTGWRQVPARWLPRIEAMSGIPARTLRPDLFDSENAS